MANLATVAADGSPRNAPVWFIWEDEVWWMLGSVDGSSARRLNDNPRCAVEIVRFNNAEGVLLHLGLRGDATVVPTVRERFQLLLDKYLGTRDRWNRCFIDNVSRIDDPDGRMIRLVPETTFTNNVSIFRTGPDYAWE